MIVCQLPGALCFQDIYAVTHMYRVPCHCHAYRAYCHVHLYSLQSTLTTGHHRGDTCTNNTPTEMTLPSLHTQCTHTHNACTTDTQSPLPHAWSKTFAPTQLHYVAMPFISPACQAPCRNTVCLVPMVSAVYQEYTGFSGPIGSGAVQAQVTVWGVCMCARVCQPIPSSQPNPSSQHTHLVCSTMLLCCTLHIHLHQLLLCWLEVYQVFRFHLLT